MPITVISAYCMYTILLLLNLKDLAFRRGISYLKLLRHRSIDYRKSKLF